MPAAPRTCGVRATMNDELRAGSEAAPLRAAFPARRPDMHEAEAKAARTIRARATPGRPYCTSVATRRLSQPQERSEACAPSEGGSQPTPLTTSEWAAGTGRAASVERSTREREPSACPAAARGAPPGRALRHRTAPRPRETRREVMCWPARPPLPERRSWIATSPARVPLARDVSSSGARQPEPQPSRATARTAAGTRRSHSRTLPSSSQVLSSSADSHAAAATPHSSHGSAGLCCRHRSACAAAPHAHTRTVPSALPEASRAPPGAHATHVTAWSCSEYTATGSRSSSPAAPAAPVPKRHTVTLPASSPLATRPGPAHATAAFPTSVSTLAITSALAASAAQRRTTRRPSHTSPVSEDVASATKPSGATSSDSMCWCLVLRSSDISTYLPS
mmetsp:Transcript_10217/g.32560  ORF Transcript_10217/g.32560 Transcript_10217/m.32560 type:complete len:393 (+) Transcript_10217:233-1411(+)